MWMIDPKFLCRKHLLGVHVECHMLLGSLKKGRNFGKLVDKGFIELRALKIYHDSIADEIIRRGYNHNSPLEDYDFPDIGRVNVEKSIIDLCFRCEECKNRLQHYNFHS